MSTPKGWKVITYKDMDDNKESQEKVTEKVGENSETENSNKIKMSKKEDRPLIWGDLTAKAFWKRNIFPVFLEAAFLILCMNNTDQIIYINFFFYLVLFFYYLITKGFTFRNLSRNIASGSNFWHATITCVLLLASAYVLTSLLSFVFPSLDTGFYPIGVSDTLGIILFAITTMFLAPIVEETFFRGNLISLESKKFRAISTFASVMLFAILHSFTWWGILCAVIWAIPLTIVFIKTRNFYVTMVAHLIVNIIGNIPTLISFMQ